MVAEYATGVSLQTAGVVSGGDMTVEAALTKLGCLLGETAASVPAALPRVNGVVAPHCNRWGVVSSLGSHRLCGPWPYDACLQAGALTLTLSAGKWRPACVGSEPWYRRPSAFRFMTSGSCVGCCCPRVGMTEWGCCCPGVGMTSGSCVGCCCPGVGITEWGLCWLLLPSCRHDKWGLCRVELPSRGQGLGLCAF